MRGMSQEPALRLAVEARGGGVATGAERAWVDDARHHVIARGDPRFPRSLEDLRDPPAVLFVDGDPLALADPLLAIVGSRGATAQGRANAHAFAAALARRGVGVVSGLAQGVDVAAHAGALAVAGTTIAVLGSGVDVVYPREHAELAGAIAARGALVSEFALGTPPRREHFPRRNRLIAALSLGTLVIEAARRSGSLITARHALELGREVFALPGSIHNPLSRGCHALIKEGAKLTETVDDILTELNFSAFFARSTARIATSAAAAARPSTATAGMDKDRKILLDALGFDPADLDTLVVRTGFSPQTVSSMLLFLELEGHVRAAPGGRYSRVTNRSAGGEG